MGYVWTEDIGNAADIEDTNVDEIRTNINTERVDRAGLAAYVWTNVELEGDEIAQAEIAELRTATDGAYDELATCATHYSADDVGHYTTDKTSHDSSDDSNHDSGEHLNQNTGADAGEYATHNANHDGGHYVTHYGTHKAAYYASRKSWYNTYRCGSYLKWRKELLLRRIFGGKE